MVVIGCGRAREPHLDSLDTLCLARGASLLTVSNPAVPTLVLEMGPVLNATGIHRGAHRLQTESLAGGAGNLAVSHGGKVALVLDVGGIGNVDVCRRGRLGHGWIGCGWLG